jgi:undecaprenyl-diphosphatase
MHLSCVLLSCINKIVMRWTMIATLAALLLVAAGTAASGTASLGQATAPGPSASGTSIDSLSADSDRGGTENASIAAPSDRAGLDEASIDVHLFRYLNGSIRNTLFDVLMPAMTDFRRSRVVVILVWAALVMFGGAKGRWAGLMLIPIVAASDQLSSHLLKPFIERLRPCELLGNVHFWDGPEGWILTPPEAIGGFKASFSFPSSHAANITSSMLFLALAYRRWMALPLAVMVLVSFSRIYVGVHWPSDVAVGMLLGAVLAVPSYLLFRRLSAYDGAARGAKESSADTNG